jgi:hypothetical protein
MLEEITSILNRCAVSADELTLKLLLIFMEKYSFQSLSVIFLSFRHHSYLEIAVCFILI